MRKCKIGTEEAYVSLHPSGSVETRHKWELARAKLGGGKGRRFFYIKKAQGTRGATENKAFWQGRCL